MKEAILITDDETLDSVCKQLKQSNWLAIDTEFIREKTYYPQLCLIQIANTEQICCVDPLSIENLEPLFELTDDPKITKVFHAADQDLEIFFNLTNRLPTSIFDTQIAASLLGFGEQISYASLVNKMLQIELDKSHSRTDWMQRPLHSEQLLYAANDVRYLSQLYPLLIKQLEQLNRLDWMGHEQARLTDPQTYQVSPLACWQRVKGNSKLKRKRLNILRHLAAWREQRAMQSNRPRRWIVSDDVLLNLAMQRPQNHEQLMQIRQLETKTAERYADEWLQLIDIAQKEDEQTWPNVSLSKKPSMQEDATVDILMSVIHLCANKYQLSPGQISSRSELLKLVRGERELSLLNGWRLRIAGQEILDTINGKQLLVCDKGLATSRPNQT